MFNYPEVELISFDSEDNNNGPLLENNDIDMDYLNNFLLEKYDNGDERNESIFMFENTSQVTYYCDSDNSKLNDSFSTNPASVDKISPSKSFSSFCNSEKAPESSGKLFNCEYEGCDKTFKYKWILDRHYLSHKASKVFSCTYKDCLKAYKSKENLTLHIKNIHLNLKPYNCKFCPSVFSHRNGKTYHERKFHTNYLPHKCLEENCELTFASKSALAYHFKSKHSRKLSSNKNSGFIRSKFNEDNLNDVNELKETPFSNNFTYGLIKSCK